MKITLASAAVVPLLVLAPAAHAEDKRPCVSVTEYAQTRDVVKFRTNAPAPTRRQLETRWEVRGRGVVDRDISDDKDTLVDYQVCGYAPGDSVVSVVYNGRGGRAAIMTRYTQPGAVPTGSVYR